VQREDSGAKEREPPCPWHGKIREDKCLRQEDINEYGIKDMYGYIYKVVTSYVKAAQGIVKGKAARGQAALGLEDERNIGKAGNGGIICYPCLVIELKGPVNGIGIGEQYQDGKAKKQKRRGPSL